MRIGIIGTGNMGRALGLRWARGGHDVLFGSRDLSKAETAAASAPNSAQAGDFDAAAESLRGSAWKPPFSTLTGFNPKEMFAGWD
jgi:predicted dinucleotide-binding enzyme